MRINLFTKFVIAVSMVAVVPIAFLGYQLIKIGQTAGTTARLEANTAIVDKIAGIFENYVQEIDKKILFLNNTLRQMDWDNKQTLLKSFMDIHGVRKISVSGESREIGDFREISVISNAGTEIIKVYPQDADHALPLISYEKDRDFIKARDTRKQVSLINPSREGHEMTVYFPSDKNFVLKSVVSLNKISEMIRLTEIGTTGFVFIVDSEGNPLIYPPKFFDEKNLSQVKNLEIVRRSLDYLGKETTTPISTEYSDISGKNYIGAFRTLPSINMAVIAQQSKEEAYRSAAFLQKKAWQITAGFLVVVFLVAYLMSRQLSRPIIKLTKVAEYVADGDFSHQVSINSKDELRDLAETFNRMVRQLKTYSDMQVDRIIREQKKTEAILFSTEDGIVMTDYDGKIQLANRKARSVLGLNLNDSMEGRILTDTIGDEKIKVIISDVIRNPKENYFKEFEMSLHSTKRVFKCFSMPVIGPQEKTGVGLLIAIHDITLEKEIAKIKDDFLHSITHDLRNPMGAIKGFVEFLIKEIPGPVNEAQKKMLVSIDRASFRLLGMINNILDIAKMEAGKIEIKLSRTCVSDIAQRIIDLLEPLGQRKNVKFVLNSPAGIMLEADAELIERVFTNLIGNAIKFTPEQGMITVNLKESDSCITASVEDTGDGIPPEYLGKVFEKFEQVKGQKQGGTGLGLTICKYIVQAHLGRIWVESEIGKGAKFFFLIPQNLQKDETGKVVVKQTV